MRLLLLGIEHRTFPDIDDPLAVESISMRGCRFSAAPIGAMRNIEGVEILDLADDSINFLSELKRLRYLRLHHLPKVTSLEPLRHLTTVEVLRLETTPGWDASSKRTVVSSLAPIAAMPALRHLELFGVVSPDRSLAELEAAQELTSARVTGFRAKEVDRFRAAAHVSNDWAPRPEWENFHDNQLPPRTPH